MVNLGISGESMAEAENQAKGREPALLRFRARLYDVVFETDVTEAELPPDQLLNFLGRRFHWLPPTELARRMSSISSEMRSAVARSMSQSR